MSTGGLSFEEWKARNSGGTKPQTPMAQWQLATLPDGSQYWYDPASNTRVPVGRESYRTINGQLVAIDPAGNAHVVEVQGLQPVQPTPSQQLTAEKQGKSGDIEWAGYSPTAMWTSGGTKVTLDAYDQVSVLQQRIADLQAKREELVRLSDPRFQNPEDRAGDTAAMQRQLDQVNKDIEGYANQLVMVAQKNKLNLGGGIGNYSAGTGSTRVQFASEAERDQAAAALNRAQTAQIEAETPGIIANRDAQTGYYGAQTEYQKAQTAKTQRDMQPAQQKAIQDLYDSIGTIQGMMEQGQMTPAEASAYIDAFQKNLMAQTMGTTPWQMQLDKQSEERQRADIGRELLNQRVASGSGVANALLGLLGSVGGRLAGEPGSVQFDPFAMAKQFTDEMGGGQEISDLGKALLGQIRPGAQSVPAPATPLPTMQQQATTPTTTVTPGTTTGSIGSVILRMLAEQPDLARSVMAQAGQ